MSDIRTKRLPDGTWFAVLEKSYPEVGQSHPGVWGSGDTEEEAIDELPEVLRGWHQVGGSVGCDCVLTFTSAT